MVFVSLLELPGSLGDVPVWWGKRHVRRMLVLILVLWEVGNCVTRMERVMEQRFFRILPVPRLQQQL